MDAMKLIDKWFLAMGFVVTLLNASVFWYRASKHIQQNPELKSGYKKLIIGFIFWSILPWVPIGIGRMTGGLSSVFNLFRFRDGNFYVISAYIILLIEIIVTTYWLFFRGGAEMLVKHPGLFSTDPASAGTIKFWWILILLGPILVMMVLFVLDIPIPNHR